MTARVASLLVALGFAPVVVLAQSTTGSQPSSDQPQFSETVDVVGATPLHGVGVDRDKIPANVQVATADDLARTQGLYIGEHLLSAFASTHVNEAQNNPFQPDIQFRGFTASPLLGQPSHGQRKIQNEDPAGLVFGRDRDFR